MLELGSCRPPGLAGRHGNLRRARGGWLQYVNEVEPLESDSVCLEQIEQRLRRLSVHGHEVIVCVVLEQLVASCEDVAVVLNQPLRSGVRLMNLALSAIAREEPVVSQGSCVLLFRE